MNEEVIGWESTSNKACRICEHIKDNGIRCGSPALAGERLCHFHIRIYDVQTSPEDPNYNLPVLETEQSVQIALQQMMRGLLSGKLSEKKSKVMLSGIKAAAALIRQAKNNVPREDLLNEIASELRARMPITNGKPPRSVTNLGEEEPAVAL